MKTNTSTLILGFVWLIANFQALSQTVTLESGELHDLKRQKDINIEFYYNKVMVNNMPEAEYIEKTKNELNAKEAGKGDEWEKNWNADRGARFEPTFMTPFQNIPICL